MSEVKKGPVARYGMIQAGYWIDYLVINNFAAVFLSGRGFTTGQIGIVTGLGSLFSCLLQQVSGTIADKSEKPLKYMVMGFVSLSMACFLAMKFLPDSYMSTFVFYTTAITLTVALQPLLNSLCLQFTNNNYTMNFGLARSMGSLGFAVSALFMGRLTEICGSEAVLSVFLLVSFVMMVILACFPIPKKDVTAVPTAGDILLKDEKPSTMKEFVHRYHRFMTLTAGFVLLWFMADILGTYMMYFIDYYHGTAAQMSLPFSIMAFAEIPAIVFGNRLMKKMGADHMLRISAAGGLLKSVLLFAAPNVQFFIWTQLTHFLHSGFYQVSAVYYCYSIVSEKDIVKGQSLLGIAAAGLATMAANCIGGILLECVSIRTICLIGIVTSALALYIIWIGTDPKRFKGEPIRRI